MNLLKQLLSGIRDSALQTNSQVMLILLDGRPHFEWQEARDQKRKKHEVTKKSLVHEVAVMMYSLGYAESWEN